MILSEFLGDVSQRQRIEVNRQPGMGQPDVIRLLEWITISVAAWPFNDKIQKWTFLINV